MRLRPPPLQLDFFRESRRTWPGWLLLVAGLALATGAVTVAWQAREKAQELNERLARTASATTGQTSAGLDPAQAKARDDEIRQANLALTQLTLPWETLIGAVARAVTPGIALLALQPDTRKRVVAITAEAVNHEAMTGFWRALSASPALKEVHVTEYQIDDRDPQRPLRFIILAQFTSANEPASHR